MKEILISELKNDSFIMSILSAINRLDLPDCWVGAGIIRNKAWDFLHNYKTSTPLNDIDVIYLDKKNNSMTNDRKVECEIQNSISSDVNIEVVNQARTHLWHNREPYTSTEEAVSEWVETATCVAARLNSYNKIELIAPHGFNDLENLILRPTSSLSDINIFYKRIANKQWQIKWPNLKLFNEI